MKTIVSPIFSVNLKNIFGDLDHLEFTASLVAMLPEARREPFLLTHCHDLLEKIDDISSLVELARTLSTAEKCEAFIIAQAKDKFQNESYVPNARDLLFLSSSISEKKFMSLLEKYFSDARINKLVTTGEELVLMINCIPMTEREPYLLSRFGNRLAELLPTPDQIGSLLFTMPTSSYQTILNHLGRENLLRIFPTENELKHLSEYLYDEKKSSALREALLNVAPEILITKDFLTDLWKKCEYLLPSTKHHSSRFFGQQTVYPTFTNSHANQKTTDAFNQAFDATQTTERFKILCEYVNNPNNQSTSFYYQLVKSLGGTQAFQRLDSSSPKILPH